MTSTADPVMCRQPLNLARLMACYINRMSPPRLCKGGDPGHLCECQGIGGDGDSWRRHLLTAAVSRWRIDIDAQADSALSSTGRWAYSRQEEEERSGGARGPE